MVDDSAELLYHFTPNNVCCLKDDVYVDSTMP